MTPAVSGLGHPGWQVFQLPGIVVAPLAGAVQEQHDGVCRSRLERGRPQQAIAKLAGLRHRDGAGVVVGKHGLGG